MKNFAWIPILLCYLLSSSPLAWADPDLSRIMPQVQRVHLETGVPENVLLAVIKVESDVDPLAESPKRALGLMQVKPATASEMGVDPDKLFDPYHNILAGARYLKKMVEKFNGSWALGFSAYYMGPGRVRNRAELSASELQGLARHLGRLDKYIKHYSEIKIEDTP